MADEGPDEAKNELQLAIVDVFWAYVDQLYFLALEEAEAGAQILQLLCLDKRPFIVDAESLGTGDTLQQLYQNKSVLKVRLQICDLPGGCFLVPAQGSVDVPHKGSLLK